MPVVVSNQAEESLAKSQRLVATLRNPFEELLQRIQMAGHHNLVEDRAAATYHKVVIQGKANRTELTS